jgi:hypothetical protein
MTIVRDHKLGIWMTGALVVGSMIGSGIFMLPVSLAPLGANAVLGWVVSIFGALAIAFALASLSRTGEGGFAPILNAHSARPPRSSSLGLSSGPTSRPKRRLRSRRHRQPQAYFPFSAALGASLPSALARSCF